MKEKIIYIVSFLLAFAFVTGLLIYLNSSFKNIFAFDFSPANQTVTEIKKPAQPYQTNVQPKDSTILSSAFIDSLKQTVDTTSIKTTTVTLKDSNAVQTIKKKLAEEIKPSFANLQSKLADSIKTAQSAKMLAKRDSTYRLWVKNTGKLYESMDTKKAAKIIQGYSDNIARDLLLTMKKKKAAEIIAEFKPETATRIISVVQ